MDELFSAQRWVTVNGNVLLLKKLSHKNDHIRTMHQVGKLNIKDVSFNKKEKRIKRSTCFDVTLFVINLLKKFVLNTCLRLLQTHLLFPLPLKSYECVSFAFMFLPLYLYLFCFLNRDSVSFSRKVIRENLRASRETQIANRYLEPC